MENHIAKGHEYKEGDDFDHFCKQGTTNGVRNGLKLLWDEFELNVRRKDVNPGAD